MRCKENVMRCDNMKQNGYWNGMICNEMKGDVITWYVMKWDEIA